MKTFDEKDLITWSNREKAEVSKEYYFADSLIGMKSCINNNYGIYTLDYIAEDAICKPFNCSVLEGKFSYACLLPIDKVIDEEPEKKYRACKTIKELYELVNNTKCEFDEEECVYGLLDGYIIHIRNKSTGREYYSRIVNIAKDEENYILITYAGYSLLDLFNKFEIEIDGKWLPFGVEDNEKLSD